MTKTVAGKSQKEVEAKEVKPKRQTKPKEEKADNKVNTQHDSNTQEKEKANNGAETKVIDTGTSGVEDSNDGSGAVVEDGKKEKLTTEQKLEKQLKKRADKLKEREDERAKKVAEREKERTEKLAAAEKERTEKLAAEFAAKEAAKEDARKARAEQREKDTAEGKSAREAAKAQEKIDREAARVQRDEERKSESAKAKEDREKERKERERLIEERRAVTKLGDGRRRRASHFIYTGAGISSPHEFSTRGKVLEFIKKECPVGEKIDIKEFEVKAKPVLYGNSIRSFLSKLEEMGHVDFYTAVEPVVVEAKVEGEKLEGAEQA